MIQVPIASLEAYLRETYGTEFSEQSLFMKLVEEIGEVAEILNKRAGRKVSDEENLEQCLSEELADVIHYALAIAAVNQLDMTKIILEKDREASIKYHHDMNLLEFLEQRK